MDGHDPIAAPTNDLVVFVCADGRHVDIGRTRPDGSGHLTLRDGAWAYCAAGRPTEPHTWVEISPRLLPAISHEDGPGQEATS
ncbi:MAG TPA: hypothetical protein VIN74_04425 [Candidatus Limnocylindria bacterium]|jgi:hypothetical protein